jgi:hypothetical protein
VLSAPEGGVCSLVFHPLSGGRVLRLDAQVKGVDYGAPPWEAEEETAERRAVARAKGEAFTTAKRQRVQARLAAQRGADAVPDAAGLEAFMARAVKGELTSAQQTAALAASRNIPPHAPDAAEPRLAYPLSGLLPRSLQACRGSRRTLRIGVCDLSSWNLTRTLSTRCFGGVRRRPEWLLSPRSRSVVASLRA